MFMTEIRGGSDLACSECAATKAGDGSWRLNGAKWFCSNLDARGDPRASARRRAHRRSRRPRDVPRAAKYRSDGTRNGMHIRRFKDKLGTKSVPTGEVDFIDAEAYLMGGDAGAGSAGAFAAIHRATAAASTA